MDTAERRAKHAERESHLAEMQARGVDVQGRVDQAKFYMRASRGAPGPRAVMVSPCGGRTQPGRYRFDPVQGKLIRV